MGSVNLFQRFFSGIFPERKLLPVINFLNISRNYGKRQESRPWKQKPNRRPRMSLILTDDVPKLGFKGDLVRVKHGYGRNFLLPQSKAVYANHENCKFYGIVDTREKTADVQQTETQVSNIPYIEKFLSDKTLIIYQDEKAYNWSIREQHISQAFAKQFQLHVPIDCIELSTFITEFGMSEVTLRLSEDELVIREENENLQKGIRISIPVEVVHKVKFEKKQTNPETEFEYDV